MMWHISLEYVTRMNIKLKFAIALPNSSIVLKTCRYLKLPIFYNVLGMLPFSTCTLCHLRLKWWDVSEKDWCPLHSAQILPYKLKMHYVHNFNFSILRIMEHFEHTAFLLCQTIMLYLQVVLNKERVLMFINYNPYQNIFQMTLKFLACSWWYCAVDAFAHTAFLLCQTIFS